ncbi:Imm32 family immunity protein [Thalassomonas haliotis]|uniref:Uncharacterized protein n=1 Tax=Thalassomonas haliotis TaxID=485448 RepID=A0ABY7V9V4_9GAMM|nr:hypothetical protein [Thalassomonas haliotis]WDE10394.1 hypothetical protein H3N35_19250 [Thalassomonas haliotis]
MKLFGYSKENGKVDTPIELSEITLCSNAEELRVIAKFLVDAANKMEIAASDFEHTHLSEVLEVSQSTEIIVYNEASL